MLKKNIIINKIKKGLKNFIFYLIWNLIIVNMIIFLKNNLIFLKNNVEPIVFFHKFNY